MQIIVSSPGKIHMLGEHSVVYGFPSLLASIDKRLYVSIKSLSKIDCKKEVEIVSSEDKKLVYETLDFFKKIYSIGKLPYCRIEITSQIPVGSGLGSSAALSSALIGALMKAFKNIWNPSKINELAYSLEKKAHGNPSGADNTTVVFGGLVWYRREFDFLKSIWSLPILSYKIPKFVIINTGRSKESTLEMVKFVEKKYQQKRKTVESLFIDQEKQTKKLLLALKTGQTEKIMEAIKKGERNLEKLQVVGKKAEEIIRGIERIGGVAKVCGAGGRKSASGALLCFHSDLSQIVKFAQKRDLPVESLKLGEEGIRIEKQEK